MVIFIVRHADRSSGSVDSLSPAGLERAESLSRMLAGVGVTKAFCSDARRSHQTLAPLKAVLGTGLAVEEVPIGGTAGPTAHVENVTAAIESLADDAVVIVVSHSNTVGRIIERLGEGASLRSPTTNSTICSSSSGP